jgi:hypothetical protein
MVGSFSFGRESAENPGAGRLDNQGRLEIDEADLAPVHDPTSSPIHPNSSPETRRVQWKTVSLPWGLARTQLGSFGPDRPRLEPRNIAKSLIWVTYKKLLRWEGAP